MDKNPGKDVVATGPLYSDVLKGDPSPTWLRRYQEEDEEEAVKRAIKESVKVTISQSFIIPIYQLTIGLYLSSFRLIIKSQRQLHRQF